MKLKHGQYVITEDGKFYGPLVVTFSFGDQWFRPLVKDVGWDITGKPYILNKTCKKVIAVFDERPKIYPGCWVEWEYHDASTEIFGPLKFYSISQRDNIVTLTDDGKFFIEIAARRGDRFERIKNVWDSEPVMTPKNDEQSKENTMEIKIGGFEWPITVTKDGVTIGQKYFTKDEFCEMSFSQMYGMYRKYSNDVDDMVFVSIFKEYIHNTFILIDRKNKIQKNEWTLKDAKPGDLVQTVEEKKKAIVCRNNESHVMLVWLDTFYLDHIYKEYFDDFQLVESQWAQKNK